MSIRRTHTICWTEMIRACRSEEKRMPILCIIAFCMAVDTAAIARELKKIREIMEEGRK